MARRPEYEGGRALSDTREAYPEREVTVREGLTSDAQPEERTLPSAVRVAGYACLLAVAVAASIVLGGTIAVGMEYLVGWRVLGNAHSPGPVGVCDRGYAVFPKGPPFSVSR